jgi:hypothetical protein
VDTRSLFKGILEMLGSRAPDNIAASYRIALQLLTEDP